MSDISLKKLAGKLSGVAGSRSLTSKDMEVLREVKEGIVAILQGLKECDCCGAAVTEIARLELDGVRAAVCSACGIKALKNKSLVIRNVKKKEAAKDKSPEPRHHEPKHHEGRAAAPAHKTHDHPKPAEKKKPFRTEPHPESHVVEKPRAAGPAAQPTLFGEAASASEEKGDNVYDEIAKEAGSKIMTVKKVQQLASAIAFPMNFDRTLSYTRMEAQSQGLHLNPEELKKILIGLNKKAGLRIKE